MKNNTNTLVASPNIQGNIGICTTEKIDVITSRELFTETIQTIATNSCTGEVSNFYHWELTGLSVMGGLFLILMSILGMIIFIKTID